MGIVTTPYASDVSVLSRAFEALEADLLDPTGPRVSTMRSSDQFAIVPYSPADEFACRQHAQRLSARLSAAGWVVIPISLHELLMQRLQGLPPDELEEIEALETRSVRRGDLESARRTLARKLEPLVEGQDGLAADVATRIAREVERHSDRMQGERARMVALVGRTGAVYPFFRTSGLLKYLAGHTRGVPVVLLYAGGRRGEHGLSYMNLLDPDRDYRPRIYP
jgi:hypothetical protein